MPDQIQKPGEMQSPEFNSLEKRFGVEDQDMKFDKEKSTEKTFEQNSAQSDNLYQKILSKVKAQNNDENNDSVMQDASTLHQQTDRESQITHLIDLASVKGVGYAVKVARKAEDYYVLDQLHDRLLAEDLHNSLKDKGLIKDL